jgi:hypothetical protein
MPVRRKCGSASLTLAEVDAALTDRRTSEPGSLARVRLLSDLFSRATREQNFCAAARRLRQGGWKD